MNDQKNYIPDYYVYTAELSALTAGSSQTAQINIEADANFVVVKTAYFADIAGGAQTDSSRVIPLIKVALTDSGSGRNLQNSPVPIDCIAGRGSLPFVLPVPRIFSARATLNVTFSNYSAATDYANVVLAFIGYKRFSL